MLKKCDMCGELVEPYHDDEYMTFCEECARSCFERCHVPKKVVEE